MTEAEIKDKVLGLLTDVAPDVDPATVEHDVAFRDQFDFDSMDTLNFAIALHQAFNIEVPETDYRHLASLGKTIAYIRDAMVKKR